MSFRAILIIGLCAGLLGCGPGARLQRVDTAKAVDFIKVDELHWNADYRAGDADKIVAHFAPTAVVMEGGAPAAVGRSAIRSAIAEQLARPGFHLAFVSSQVDVAASGDLAAARGTYRLTADDPKTGASVTEAGAFVTVYKPGPDRTWKAVWDIMTPTPTSGPTSEPADSK